MKFNLHVINTILSFLLQTHRTNALPTDTFVTPSPDVTTMVKQFGIKERRQITGRLFCDPTCGSPLPQDCIDLLYMLSTTKEPVCASTRITYTVPGNCAISFQIVPNGGEEETCIDMDLFEEVANYVFHNCITPATGVEGGCFEFGDGSSICNHGPNSTCNNAH